MLCQDQKGGLAVRALAGLISCDLSTPVLVVGRCTLPLHARSSVPCLQRKVLPCAHEMR